MSWFIQSIGSPAAVKADLARSNTLSPKLLAALQEICDDESWPSQPNYGIFIEGSGHSGQGSYITNLKVTRVQILAETPAPQPVLENYGQTAIDAPAHTINAPAIIDA